MNYYYDARSTSTDSYYYWTTQVPSKRPYSKQKQPILNKEPEKEKQTIFHFNPMEIYNE